MSNSDVFVGALDGEEEILPFYGSWRATVSYVLAAYCFTISFASMLMVFVVATARNFTYNVYIVFLLTPEAFMNLVLGIRCIYDGVLNDSSGRFHPPMSLCVAQQIGIGCYVSNVLLNAIVFKELYTLVNNSYHRRRTQPPTIQKILHQVAVVYGITFVFITWQLLPVEWAEKEIINDPYCNALPREASQMVANVVYIILVVPAVGVVLWTWTKMTFGKILPINGRTRALVMYYMRIFAFFLIFYTPMTVVVVMYSRFDEDGRDSDFYFWLQAAFTFLNPMKSTIDLYIFLQKEDIQKKSFHYASKIYSFISFRDSKSNSSTGDSPTAKMKRKTVWRQHDTYEKEGGGVAVVTYLNPEGRPIPNDEHDDDDDDNDSDDGMDMRMWMSMPFTLQTVSAISQPSRQESTTEEASTSIPGPAAPSTNASPVPTARSNVMSILSASANGANNTQATTSGLDALRNLDYFNINTQTV